MADIPFEDLEGHFDDLGKLFLAKADQAVQLASVGFETAAKANISGRPGPRSITGNARRSINSQRTTRQKTKPSAEVGSTAVYMPRLEYGFVGTDSLGRLYNQPPYPVFGPALPIAYKLLEKHLNELL